MIEINLVPDVKQELIRAQRIRSMVITFSILVGIISVAIVAVLAFYIFAVQTVRGNLLDGSITSSSEKLFGKKEKDGTITGGIEDLSKTLTIQNQLTKIDSLNNNKKIDSRIFSVLNAIIPPAPNDVQISDLTIDSSSNLVTINGQASNSYAAVEVFKKTLEGAKVKYTDSENSSKTVTLASGISTSNTSYGEDAGGNKVLRFTLTFVYADELFSPLSKNVSVVISNKGNVTDSYLGVPKSIFTDRATDITGDQ
jgi:Tfp pilus assembly protein PilN